MRTELLNKIFEKFKKGTSGIIEIINIIPQSELKRANDAKDYWNSSDNDVTLRDLSHWRGKGRWSDDSAWKAIGKLHFSMYRELCKLTEMIDQVHSMIEWGPGGGANVTCFSKEIKTIYGIDISSSNLDECEHQLKQNGYLGFKKILFPADNPESCLHLITAKVDFFLSTAVYQHFPSKEYGIKVTNLAYQLLSNQGIAVIQIRYEDGSNRIRSKTRNYHRNAIAFTSYTIEEFWNITTKIGFKPIGIILKPETNYAYYFLKKGDETCQK